MIFQTKDALTKIVTGTKTQTRRAMHAGDSFDSAINAIISASKYGLRVRYRIGRTYAVQPGRAKPTVWYNPTSGIIADVEDTFSSGLQRFEPLRIRILEIWPDKVADINPDDVLAEGYKTRAEFIAAWKGLFPKASLHEQVWALRFEVVKP